MNRTYIHAVLFVLLGVAIASFQNCSSGFVPGTTGSSTQATALDHPKVDFGFIRNGASVAQDTIVAGSTYEISVIGTIGEFRDVKFVLNANNSANCVLVGGTSMLLMQLACANAGTATAVVSVYWNDGRVDSVTKGITVQMAALPSPTPAISLIVEFRIPVGTGRMAWNTAATYVLAFVGQTIRITNDDTTAHALHTNGSPCAHEMGTMATGGQYNCVVTAEHLNPSAGDVYDHTVGPVAAFFVKTINGATRYTNNCAGCHGALAATNRKGSSFTDIKTAIANNPNMSGVASLKNLTDEELKAIAFVLRN